MSSAPSSDGHGQHARAVPRVLLVDDDEDIRHLLKLFLTRQGECVVVGEAIDGIEGIERAQELQPDVVLLDIMMPRMSGHEAVPELRRVSPDAMIVMVSALGAGGNEELARRDGAYAYVEKSTLGVDFGRQIRRMLERFRDAAA